MTDTREKIEDLVKTLEKAEKKEFFFNKSTRNDTLLNLRVISQEKDSASLMLEVFPKLLPLLAAVVHESKADGREHALAIIINITCYIEKEKKVFVSTPLLFPFLTEILRNDDSRDIAIRRDVFAALINLAGSEENYSQMTASSLGLLSHLIKLARDHPKDRLGSVTVMYNLARTHLYIVYLFPYIFDMIPLMSVLSKDDDPEVKKLASETRNRLILAIVLTCVSIAMIYTLWSLPGWVKLLLALLVGYFYLKNH